MSLSKRLVEQTVGHLCEALSLRELMREDGVYMRLTSEAMPDFYGHLRIFVPAGPGNVERLVTTSLHMPARKAETHMVFCFGAPDNNVPHFTVDAADHGEGSYAFHLDLIPRHELGANLPYMREVYGPLTETFTAVREADDLTPVTLTPEQHAVMSPWMLVKSAQAEAFERIMSRTVPVYRDRFVQLCTQPPLPSLAPDAGRDAAFRRTLFDPSVDPVWGRVARLVGESRAGEMRQLLSGELSPPS